MGRQKATLAARNGLFLLFGGAIQLPIMCTVVHLAGSQQPLVLCFIVVNQPQRLSFSNICNGKPILPQKLAFWFSKCFFPAYQEAATHNHDLHFLLSTFPNMPFRSFERQLASPFLTNTFHSLTS
jgi:hypothetical protein